MNLKPEDLPQNLREKAKTAGTVARDNIRMIYHLEQLGHPVNTVDSEFSFFFDQLVDFGVITQEQFWDMRLAWEKHLQKELKEYRQRVEEALRKQQLLQGVPQNIRNLRKNGNK